MPKLLLIGAGHAHLAVLLALQRRRPPAVEVTWLTQGVTHAYSGMISGEILGVWQRAELTINLRALAAAAGATLDPDGAVALDAGARTVRTAAPREHQYDVASLDLGSAPEGLGVVGEQPAILLKPIARALELTGLPPQSRLAVVGAGAAGIELALCLSARGHAVTLVSSDPHFPPGAGTGGRERARQALGRAKVSVAIGRVTEVSAGELRLASGRVGFDRLIWATGAAPPPLLQGCGAALSARHFLRVNDQLQSVSHPGLFGAGDTVDLEGAPGLPKSGAVSVRQGPVLAHNLLAQLTGLGRPRRFRPRRAYLALLLCGDGTALALWGHVSARGRWAARLKQWLDRRFMERFQPPRMEGEETT